MAFLRVRSVVNKMFTKYLLVTNTVTCGCLLAIGDGITQRVESRSGKAERSRCKLVERGAGLKRRAPYDWARTGRMFIVGLMMGPFNHGWYTLLDKLIVGHSGKIALKKILADQCVAAPYFTTTFLLGMALLEGKTVKVSVQELKDKFVTIYLLDWFVWPPSQFINFYFLPTKFRVVYVCFITLIWDTILSYIKHKDQVAGSTDITNNNLPSEQS